MYNLFKEKKKKQSVPKVSKTLLDQRARKMREHVNPLEQRALDILRANNIAFKHQVTCGFYILDIVIPDKCLIIEMDGSSHNERAHKDEHRDKFCMQCGLNVLRVSDGNENELIQYLEEFPDIKDGPRLTNIAINEADRRREASNRHKAKKRKVKSTRKRK